MSAAFDHGPDAVGVHLLSPAVQDQIARVVAFYEQGARGLDVGAHLLGHPAA